MTQLIVNDMQTQLEQSRGRIHSFESFGTQDGPGTRFVIFTQGCLFKCKYCHNRDTWDLHAGKEMTAQELLNEVLPYQPFFKASRGGVTVTGGEAALQMDFVGAFFSLLKQHDIHTCFDTNGYVGKYGEALDRCMQHTDLVLLDIKQMDDKKHHALTGVSNTRTLRFAKHLAAIGKKTWVRYVVVPGYTDDEESAHKLGEFVSYMPNVRKIELLPYHQMGVHKWGLLGHEYPLMGVQPPKTATMHRIRDILKSYGIEVVC